MVDLPPPSDLSGATSVAIGRAIADTVAATDNVRLYVAPPFDALPSLPGRPPPGIELDADHVDVHLAVGALPLQPLLSDLGAALRHLLTATTWTTAKIRLHVDQLDGSALSSEAL